MSVDWILECVRKTNPQMTEKKLLEELSKCRYSAVALCMVCENDKKYIAIRKIYGILNLSKGFSERFRFRYSK